MFKQDLLLLIIIDRYLTTSMIHRTGILTTVFSFFQNFDRRFIYVPGSLMTRDFLCIQRYHLCMVYVHTSFQTKMTLISVFYTHTHRHTRM